MAETGTEKMVIIATHGAEDLERATFPFVVANAALAMDVKATVILQGGSAVMLAMKGASDHVFAPGLPPLSELMASFRMQGGELLLCTPCLKERRIAPEQLIEGARPVAAARVVQECLEATTTLNY
jgi:predicted peroxiredoxin